VAGLRDFLYFRIIMDTNTNRIKIKELCAAAGSYSIAAKLITDETQRSLSLDTIKSWTCNPESRRARTCPDWAISALEKLLQASSVIKAPLVQEHHPHPENQVMNVDV
jgi:hypothetical protein